MFFFLRRPNSRRRSLFCYAKPAGLLTLPNYQHLPVRWTVAFSLITEWAYSSGFCSGFSPDSLFISLHYCQENQISVCKIIPFISIDQIFGLFFADLSLSAFALAHRRRQSRRFGPQIFTDLLRFLCLSLKAYHTSQFSTLSSQLSVAHRFSQISKIYLSEKRESGSPLARERCKRRSIVYTPKLPHS